MTRRIVRRRDVMGGAPCLEGTRIPPQAPWHFWRDGWSPLRISLDAYSSLSEADVVDAIVWCERRKHIWRVRRWLAERIVALAERVADGAREWDR